jgi:hypothetical protein
MKDILFIRLTGLTVRSKKLLYIDELLNAGFKVEYWNVGYCFFSTIPTIPLNEIVNSDYHIKINTFDELLNKLQKLQIGNTIINISHLIPGIGRYRVFYSLVNKYKYLTFYFTQDPTRFYDEKSRWEILFQSDFKDKIRKIKSFLKNRIKYLFSKPLGPAFSYDIFIGSNPPANCTRRVFINCRDYNAYRMNSHLPDLIKVRYAVFLDEYFPLHPEISLIYGIGCDEEAVNRYLNLMCTFFKIIERQFGVQVVIAAHPSSKYTEADYGGRVVIKDKTNQLVQHAEFVISPGSTAVSFAILRHCPVLYCYTNDEKKMFFNEFLIHKMESRYLRTPFVQVEQYVANPDLPLPKPYIDYDACEKCKYTHLTRPEIENKDNKDIIIEFFKSL